MGTEYVQRADSAGEQCAGGADRSAGRAADLLVYVEQQGRRDQRRTRRADCCSSTTCWTRSRGAGRGLRTAWFDNLDAEEQPDVSPFAADGERAGLRVRQREPALIRWQDAATVSATYYTRATRPGKRRIPHGMRVQSDHTGLLRVRSSLNRLMQKYRTPASEATQLFCLRYRWKPESLDGPAAAYYIFRL